MGLLNRAPIQDGDGLVIQRQDDRERVIALAGNPNVGKSTVFNALTGLNQHTGNWPGKTVANAQGRYRYGGENFILVDIPGTYSLMANSLEEEVARDFICFGEPDTVVVVTDATCLERNLNLVLQVLEVTGRMVVCVNLMDEAKKKGITIDLAVLSRELGVPVVGASARQGKGLPDLMEAISQVSFGEAQSPRDLYYGKEIEEAIALLMPRVSELCGERMNPRWACLKLLDGDDTLSENLERFLGMPVMADPAIQECLTRAREGLGRAGIGQETMRDQVVSRIVCQAERDDAKLERVRNIPLAEMHPFKGHPFKVQNNEEMQRMIESIHKVGAITPALARPLPDGGYELISGHRRLAACQVLGVETMPVIVRELSDDEAVIAMVDANLQRETILPSEKAFAYKMKLDALNHQGITSGQVGQKWSREKMADEAIDSGRQIQRYIRLTYLIPELLSMVDDGKIAFNPAVELSYLDSYQQRAVLDAMALNDCTPSHAQSIRLKKLAQEGLLYDQMIYTVLAETKPNQQEQLKFKREDLRKYFPSGYTEEQMRRDIIKELELLKRQRERNRDAR